ncbi:MAG: hypothetical protein ACYC55_05840 [Candidatus Geothermincolia bacterium]
MSKPRKAGVAGAIAIIIVGLLAVSVPLAKSGAVSRAVDKYNLINMIDSTKPTMADLNTSMASIRGNASLLNEKLDVLQKSKNLLTEQISVVDGLLAEMGKQEPMLQEANSHMDDAQAGLNTTLALVQGLAAPVDSLIAEMGRSIDVTGAVSDGMAQAVGIASTMSGQLSDTIRFLARMQPQSAKAHHYMGIIPLDLGFLSSFLPAPSSAPTSSTPSQNTMEPAAPQVPVVTPLVDAIGDSTGGLLDLVGGLLGGK